MDSSIQNQAGATGGLRAVLVAILIAYAAVSGGCATMANGTTQQVSFQTSPEDVTVTLIQKKPGYKPSDPFEETSRVLGKTPLTVNLDRLGSDIIQSAVLSKDGYKSVTVNMTSSLSAWFWGNLAIGGVLGSTTDSISGGAYEYSPNQFFVTLTSQVGSTIENGTLKSQREKAREYLVRNHRNVMSDVQKGDGENLKALFTLLHIEVCQEAEALRKIRALSQVYSDIPEFGGQVAALFLK
jgi:hypothetical protein